MNIKSIKDAARQAFRDQQLQDTEGGVPDVVSFCAGFLAGARHRQAEIDELISVLDLKKETLVELEAENKIMKEELSSTKVFCESLRYSKPDGQDIQMIIDDINKVLKVVKK